jgi:hypothetical protein
MQKQSASLAEAEEMTAHKQIHAASPLKARSTLCEGRAATRYPSSRIGEALIGRRAREPWTLKRPYTWVTQSGYKSQPQKLMMCEQGLLGL